MTSLQGNHPGPQPAKGKPRQPRAVRTGMGTCFWPPLQVLSPNFQGYRGQKLLRGKWTVDHPNPEQVATWAFALGIPCSQSGSLTTSPETTEIARACS